MQAIDPKTDSGGHYRAAVIFTFLIVAVATVWFLLTPAGLEGKLAAIGYTVCHQNPEHTLQIGGRLLPLCARCTGMFLGSLAGIALLFDRRKPAGYPARKFWPVLAALVLFFVADGLNSALFTLLPDNKILYPPSNSLRLFSGMGMGLVIACVLVPISRQTMDREVKMDSSLHSWRQMFLLLVVGGLIAFVILRASAWLYYPVALLSIAGVLLLLTMVYSLLWILILKKENSFRNCKDRFTYISLGCLTAFLQMGILDLVRFAVTGTWSGFRF